MMDGLVLLGATDDVKAKLKVGTRVSSNSYYPGKTMNGTVAKAAGGWDFWIKWDDGSGSVEPADLTILDSSKGFELKTGWEGMKTIGSGAKYGNLAGAAVGLGAGVYFWKAHRVWGGILGSMGGGIAGTIIGLIAGAAAAKKSK